MKSYAKLFLTLFWVLFFGLAFQQSQAQCTNPGGQEWSQGALIAHAQSDPTAKTFIQQYRRSQFFNESVSVTYSPSNGTVTVSFIYEPKCLQETPPCQLYNQFVGVTLRCADLVVLAIAVS